MRQIRTLYMLLILADLTIAWIRLLAHFQQGAMLFRPMETAIKLTVMLFVLKGKRWAWILQLLLCVVALLSTLMLFTQTNSRAVIDPFTWISLGAQILAGGLCAFWLGAGQEDRQPE